MPNNTVIKRFEEVVKELGYDTSITLQLGHYFNDKKERIPYEKGSCGLTVYHRGLIYSYIVPTSDLGYNTIRDNIIKYVKENYERDKQGNI